MAQRLVYAPEVIVYIKTDKEILNVTEDVISGSVTRRTDAPSSASIKLQNRNKFYNGRLKPMDRIIIYLKKTKPILVFSGYLDSAPYLQPIPGPITINASCTLKLLEFTYFDPGLPTVQILMSRFVGAGDDFAAVPDLGNNSFAFLDTRGQGDNGTVEEVGFGRMLLFLVATVGKWPKDKVHILPIPDGWIENAVRLLQQIQKNEEASNQLAADVVKKLVTASGTAVASNATGLASDLSGGVVLNASAEEIANKIDGVIKTRRPNAPYNGYGKIFVREGIKQGIDPRFMAAITGAESSFGEDSGAQSTHNGFGDLDGNARLIPFASWEAGLIHLAKWLKENYINEGKVTVETIRAKWAPAGAANDPTNLNDNWVPNVSKIMTEMGGDPSRSVKLTSDSNLRARASGEELATAGTEVVDAIDSLTGGSASVATVASAVTSAAGSLVTSTSSSNTGKFTVVIEPGHAEPRQQGFPQVGAGPEGAKNKIMAQKVEALLRADPRIVLKTPNGSNLSSSNLGNPDIFVSLHHNSDPSTCVDHPSTASKNDRGEGLPNATGATPPRRDIFTNSQLIEDSTKLANAISVATGIPRRTLSTATKNYYGFYFSNAKACVIVEIAAATATYDYDAKAVEIANGILAFISGGGPAGGGSGSADNSPAAQFIQLCVTEAQANEASGWTKTPYDIQSGWRSGPLKNKPDGKGIDCSGFMKAVADEMGIENPFFGTTYSMDDHGTPTEDLKPGVFLVRGATSAGNSGGGNAHTVLYIGDDKVVESSTVGNRSGTQINSYTSRTQSSNPWRKYTVPEVGTTDSPGTWAGGGEGSVDAGAASQFSSSQALNAVFDFPGNALESITLQGARALENDVKLLEIVGQVAQASLRTFASHPNGDFMAWFPDYFNTSGRTPYMIINENEIVDCTIELSDKNLATHVFVNGDIYGLNALGTGSVDSLITKLTTGRYGVVNIEQAYLLDTFLTSKTTRDKLAEQFDPKNDEKPKRKRVPELIGQDGVQGFLKRYGARPYSVNNPILRHPYMNFFIAYQWFQRKWAEQFESNVSFTFMPELFPGTIIKMRGLNVNFYVSEVTHNFDFSSGFTTTATVMAPSTDAGGYNFGMALSQPPFKVDSKDDIEGMDAEAHDMAESKRKADAARKKAAQIRRNRQTRPPTRPGTFR